MSICMVGNNFGRDYIRNICKSTELTEEHLQTKAFNDKVVQGYMIKLAANAYSCPHVRAQEKETCWVYDLLAREYIQDGSPGGTPNQN